MKSAYESLITEGKGTLVRIRHRWEDRIKVDHKYGMRMDWFIWLRVGTSDRHL
jgi:hypothetical protein